MIAAMAQVFSFHMGAPLNLWERCSLQSFADYGHELVLFSYQPLSVPSGVRLEPADDVLSVAERDRFLGHLPNSYAQLSDLFRYELLRRFGGWWVDTDVMCQSEMLPADDVVIGRTLRGGVGIGIMKFPARHPLIDQAIAFCRSNQHAALNAHRTIFGPMLFNKLVQDHPIPIRERELFYPIQGQDIWSLGEPACAAEMRRATQQCPMLHWFQEYFRKYRLPRDRLPPAGSLLADFFASHGAPARHISLLRYRMHAQHRTGLMHGLRQITRRLKPASLTWAASD
jgi:hypothetical protein